MRLVVLTAVLACAVSCAHAQSTRLPNMRQGIWVGVGLGAASTEMDCSSCSNFRFTGLSGSVRVGFTLSRRILLGVESLGWVHTSSSVSERIGVASLVALWYPVPSGALYVKLGYGGMSYHADEGGDDLTAKARIPSLGLGYELRVRRNISLVPFVNGLVSSSVQQYRNGVPVGYGNDFSVNLVQFGVGATWH